MSQILLTVEELNKLQPLDIIQSEAVRSRFIQIHDTLWGAGTGEPAYEREAIHFNAILRDNDKLQKATKFSIFTSFIDLAVCGLSLEPGVRALCYLMGRNYCIGQDQQGKKIYEGRLVLTISGYGELVLRARSGQIRHADNPVLVYEEDGFSFTDNDGHKQVSYTCNLPHKSNHIVAAYLRITRTDGSETEGAACRTESRSSSAVTSVTTQEKSVPRPSQTVTLSPARRRRTLAWRALSPERERT